ncbi:MAG: DHH family phosphoesterase, partial [Desulfovibrionales bacterium]
MPNTLRKWNVRSSTYLPEETASWASLLSISPFLLRLLVNRGLTQLADMEVFLSPGLRHLASPEDIPGLSSAAEAVADAVFHKKKIAVWGDYDVDGITATALLADFFRRRDVPVKTILPNRLEEGYGLSLHGIERAADQGVELIITVDCGISSLPEISRA